MPAMPRSPTMPRMTNPTFSQDAATGRRRLDLVVDLGSTQYAAGDVAVRLDGRQLTVEARREIADRPSSSTSKKYELTLLEELDPTTVSTSLGGDGRLAILAFGS